MNLLIILLLILFIIFIYNFNPYGITKYLYIDITVVTLFILFLLISRFLFFNQKDIPIFINYPEYNKMYTFQFFYLILYIGITLFIYYLFTKFLFILLDQSIIVTIIFALLVISLLYSFLTIKSSFSNENLFLDIFTYIPCAISDFIEFIKKDYKKTPTTTFILFVIVIIYFILFFFIPQMYKEFNKRGSISFLKESRYLNEEVFIISQEELNKKISERLPFYDKLFTKLDNPEERKKIERTRLHHKKCKEYLKEKELIEPFISISTQDKQDIYSLERYYKNKKMSLLKSVDNNKYRDTYINCLSYSPETIDANENENLFDTSHVLCNYDCNRNLYFSYLFEHILDDFPVLKLELLKTQDTYYELKDKLIEFIKTPSSIINNQNVTDNTLYHYSISLWVYFNSFNKEINERQTIISYGNLPSLFYYPSENKLVLILNQNEYDEETGVQSKKMYETKEVLLQKWNHIVMSYQYGKFDLFINNRLVSSVKNVVPRINKLDRLFIGSEKNVNVGGVYNVEYFNIPLYQSDINYLYKTFEEP